MPPPTRFPPIPGVRYVPAREVRPQPLDIPSSSIPGVRYVPAREVRPQSPTSPSPHVSPSPHDNFHEGPLHAHSAPPVLVAPKRTEATHTSNSHQVRGAKIDMGVEQLLGFTPHDGKLFHSTSSKAWEGLGKAGGLVPATMLKDYDIERVTGEGDIFVPKEKGGIHCGQGDLGLGRAMAYFELTQDSSHFSPHLHTNQQLHAEIKQARHIIRNWDIKGGFYHQDNSKSTLGLEQVRNRLRQLETEKALRDTMPQRPRNTEPYPMMFEFGTSNGARMLRMDRIAPRIGEVAVKEPVRFEENLHRVFVPVDNLEHARGQLHRMLGPRHSVDVIPYESLQQTLHEQRNEERDPDKAYRAKAALHNKAGTYKAISRSEAEIGELYDEAAATLPLRTPNY